MRKFKSCRPGLRVFGIHGAATDRRAQKNAMNLLRRQFLQLIVGVAALLAVSRTT
jgi:hypothetical protein